MIASDCDLASEMRLLSTLNNADHGSSTATVCMARKSADGIGLRCRGQSGLQTLEIRMQIWGPATGTTDLLDEISLLTLIA